MVGATLERISTKSPSMTHVSGFGNTLSVNTMIFNTFYFGNSSRQFVFVFAFNIKHGV